MLVGVRAKRAITSSGPSLRPHVFCAMIHRRSGYDFGLRPQLGVGLAEAVGETLVLFEHSGGALFI